MKLYQQLSVVFFSVVLGVTSYAQNNYPTNYFRNPLSIPIYLAGNFGECRPNHFHSGIDIKTLGKENLPVHAAASGYVSRIKLDAVGFGHAIYITHPNGFTTLYAHLNNFEPHLQAFVKAQQYVQKKWNIDVTLKPDQFPVSQGEFIAYSGNTGSSTAPHLHFEIRNTLSEHPLNPMLFGLPIADTVAPVPLTLYVYDLSLIHI
jgi:murein DD-endopeptidase MepM/ murein hydrolase activator NlpD